MNKLFNAITTKDIVTENGMPTNSTSSNEVVDLFYKMGAVGLGSMGYEKLIGLFTKALDADTIMTVLAMFYNRDIRGGQGQRLTFRWMFNHLCNKHPDLAGKIIQHIPEYGRWDDLFAAFGTKLEGHALALIGKALLLDDDALCAKWMPREGKKGFDPYGLKIIKHLGLSRKQYRKLLASLSKVVESEMCSNAWDTINFKHVPSVAMHKYSKSFYKHTPEKFARFLEDVKAGKTTINAVTLYPHDIVSKVSQSRGVELQRLEAQWKALPNFVPEGNSFIPVCDVSGSMIGTPMEVSVALGIYLSERNKSAFKDGFITFSETPQLQYLRGSLSDRVYQLRTADWGMNTNLEAVFELILSKAVSSRLSKEDMPDTIIILSDMQFDSCVSHSHHSAMDMIKSKYTSAGYDVPNVVFWNLRDSAGVPVKYNESGVALVSGFSPSIMKHLLGNSLAPDLVVRTTLFSERYARVAESLLQ